MAGLIGLFFWSPWASEGRAHERAWLSAVEDWRTAHRDLHGQACLRAFADRVGAAPTDRMQPVAGSIRSWCRGSSWYGVSNSVHRRAPADREFHLRGGLLEERLVHLGRQGARALLAGRGLGAARGGRRGRRSRRVLARRSRGPTHPYRPLTGCVRPPPPLRPGRLHAVPQHTELRARGGDRDAGSRGRAPAHSCGIRGRRGVPRAPARAAHSSAKPAGGRGTRRRSPTWRGRSATRSSSPTTGRTHAGTAGRSTFARVRTPGRDRPRARTGRG